MTVIAQDHHLTAGAWATCAWRRSSFVAWWKNLMDINSKKKSHSTIKRSINCSVEPRWRYLCKICVGISICLSHSDQAGMSVLGIRILNLRKILSNVSTAYMMLCFSDEGESFYFIQLHTRYFSKSYTNFSKVFVL